MDKTNVMKQKFFNYSLAIAAMFLVVTSCNKKETETTAIENPEVVLPTSDSLLEHDSTNLRYDSATVKTAVNVHDEEQNAIKDEKADAEKLKADQEENK